MKKEYWIILVIVLVLVLGYVGRHRIKRMLGLTPTPVPVVQTENIIPIPTEASSSSSATVVNNTLLMTKNDPAKGDYLTDTKGMTLYIFDKDTKGVSNCSAACLKAWPPYSGASAPATLPTDVTVIKATDGKLMYAYKGMSLYYYANDSKSGDTTGDGVGGVWHLVKP